MSYEKRNYYVNESIISYREFERKEDALYAEFQKGPYTHSEARSLTDQLLQADYRRKQSNNLRGSNGQGKKLMRGSGLLIWNMIQNLFSTVGNPLRAIEKLILIILVLLVMVVFLPIWIIFFLPYHFGKLGKYKVIGRLITLAVWIGVSFIPQIRELISTSIINLEFNTNSDYFKLIPIWLEMNLLLPSFIYDYAISIIVKA